MAPFIHGDDVGGHGRTVPETAVDRGKDISVALEWKLLVPLLARGADDPQPEEERPVAEALYHDDAEACLAQAHDGVAETIREAGERAVTLRAIVKDGLQERNFWESSWIVKKANSAETLSEEKLLKGYIWVPVEICSPKMRLSDAQTQDRLHKVLNALSSRHRLTANCSCEVHVHLGQMDGQPWSLATLKRLGTLLWAAEPVLRAIRDPNSPNFNHVYTWGFEMRKHSRLAKHVEEWITQFPSPSPLPTPNKASRIFDSQVAAILWDPAAVGARDVEAIVNIWKTTTHLELGRLLSGSEKKYRRLGFNFSAFGEEDERARRNPRTFEFRIMEGSVCIDLVLSWLAICGTIAEVAAATDDPRFSAALRLLLPPQADGARHNKPSRDTGDTRPGARRALEFRELMQALGISSAVYRGFEDKIMREY